jgi:hypothetical protein
MKGLSAVVIVRSAHAGETDSQDAGGREADRSDTDYKINPAGLWGLALDALAVSMQLGLPAETMATTSRHRTVSAYLSDTRPDSDAQRMMLFVSFEE